MLQYLEEYKWKVRTGLTNGDLHQAVAPHLEGDEEVANDKAGNNAIYVEALLM